MLLKDQLIWGAHFEYLRKPLLRCHRLGCFASFLDIWYKSDFDPRLFSTLIHTHLLGSAVRVFSKEN
jgi:hypothetical protein